MRMTASKKFVDQGLPDDLQLQVHRTGQTIYVVPQGGVSDVHPVQHFHGFLPHRLVQHQLNQQGLTLRAVTGQASQVVLQQVGIRHMNVGLAAKNPQCATLAQRPELLVPRKTHQAPRQRAEQRAGPRAAAPEKPTDRAARPGPETRPSCGYGLFSLQSLCRTHHFGNLM